METKKKPCEWSEGILCPIYKNGDRKQCISYKGISLLNITYKIFAILLYNHLSKIIEPEIGNYQMGFRPNRSTIDNIFIVTYMRNIINIMSIYIIYL